MKRVVILGATSGIGKLLAEKYISEGNIVGIAGRRTNLLEEIKSLNPSNVFIKTIDTTKEESKNQLEELINDMGGMNLFIYSSGAGYVNMELEEEKEIQTSQTNVYGFTLLTNFAYHYFSKQNSGQIVSISSVAGTRDLYNCPSYCSSKRYQLMYLNCVRKLAKKHKKNIKVTCIQPGFIATDFIKGSKFPLMIQPEKAVRLIYKAIENKKDRAYIPEFWRLIVFIWYMIPNFIWKRII